MATELNDIMKFKGLSIMYNAVSAIHSATNTVWSTSNSFAHDRIVDAADSSAASIAASLATLVLDLKHRGILN